ncbi:hypothetical protein TW83_09380 [Paracoccus sp. S4493]|nr:hypothetical protein TW83_09380 [Paracoccus sp. S4493]
MSAKQSTSSSAQMINGAIIASLKMARMFDVADVGIPMTAIAKLQAADAGSSIRAAVNLTVVFRTPGRAWRDT